MNNEQSIFEDGPIQRFFGNKKEDYSTHLFMLPYEDNKNRDATQGIVKTIKLAIKQEANKSRSQMSRELN